MIDRNGKSGTGGNNPGWWNTTRVAVVLALAFPLPAATIEVVWYQQRVPGSASGEMRLEGLAEGDLVIETPGRRMEFGILRIGDVAIVNLAEPAGQPPRQAHARELVVVARQGGANTRAIFQLAMPAPNSVATLPEVPVPASPAPSGVVRPVPVPGSISSPVPVPAPSAARADHPVPAGGRLPAPERTSRPGPVKLASLDPKPALLTCPVIAIRPGSLRTNIERLLGECGAHMGDWITGGEDGKTLKDWIVRDPRILAGENRKGLAGLLDILYAEYRLQGLPSADAAAIDIYRNDR